MRCGKRAPPRRRTAIVTAVGCAAENVVGCTSTFVVTQGTLGVTCDESRSGALRERLHTGTLAIGWADNEGVGSCGQGGTTYTGGPTSNQVKVVTSTNGTSWTLHRITTTAPDKAIVAFSAPGAASVEVWRKGFGSYPTYDNGGGSVPAAPGTYPPAGWTLTGVTASGQTDEPAARDFNYYVAFAKDACGNVSPASAVTSGTLGYHLGDVSDGVTAGQGDNKVSTADVSLLGAHYGAIGGALAGFEYLDVGPTTTNNTNGRPTTDSKVNFEDLVMFALNFTPGVSLVAKLPVTAVIGIDAVSVNGPEGVTAGEEFDVAIDMSGAGDLQAVSVALKWNAAVVVPVGMVAGDWIVDRGGVVFSPFAGAADAALLGATSQGMMGAGRLAMMRFRAIATGSPAMGIDRVIGRDALNHSVTIAVGGALATPARPTVTSLQPVTPNPSRGRSFLAYSLARTGRVDLAIYSVDGRRVKSLVNRIQDAGSYQLNWDGVDEGGSIAKSGVYFVRFAAPGVRQTRMITMLK